MINFACKRFDIQEVVKCSLGLSKSEFNLLNFLMKYDKDFTTKELSEELNLDKSTIQRSIKKLHEKKLVRRGQTNQSIGGYLFYYRIKDKIEIRRVISSTVENWFKIFKEELGKW
ncbi:MAG: MarR family transcriptional regulator [Nanoarchaeota archaeon]|nr:MarR family transcriptional regulator [Nanoarchaeota archaeon]